MKIVLIGATGTIGKAVAGQLEGHEVIKVAHAGGDFQVDIGDQASIKALFEQVGEVDAIVSTAGLAAFAPLEQLTDEQFELALGNKLMGQVNLVRIGRDYLRKGGSITLTSGVLAQQPMPGSASISMVNGALEAFVKAAALELGERLRVNAVSPQFVKETMEMMGMDSQYGISAADTGKAYRQAVEGTQNGETLAVADYL